MITQLKAFHASHESWMEAVKQEPEDCGKRELKLLAADREERTRMLGVIFKIDACEILNP